MYATVQLPKASVREHRPHAGDEAIERLRSLARPLRGSRILNLSVSPFGTTTSELLSSTVPLLRDLGIAADWMTVSCDADYIRAAHTLYGGLSGRWGDWTPDAEVSWRAYSQLAATEMEGSYDVVMVHDPQPAGLPAALCDLHRTNVASHWVWHCHLDLRRAQPEAWQTLRPALEYYDICVFADRTFMPPADDGLRSTIIRPAIDPTSDRNRDIPFHTVRKLISRYGLDPSRPLVVQVAPFSPSFDPMGAVEVYRRAKTERPDIQLLLVQPMADASLDAWSRFEQVARHVGGDPDARVLASQGSGGQSAVNAAQRAATVALQRSVPAGFSLPVWEAQWKGKPVAAGTSGGLTAQIVDRETGYLATDDGGFVEAVLALVGNKEWAARLGAAGRRQVRERHLITRFLADQLQLLWVLLDRTLAPQHLEAPIHA